ncbi:uncharacterized protein PAC_09921 [Phialocephala subalpina]|uniref:Fungal N-terminal domain-containing protein n=1 Tax=Phialocephala subalpina TaxID=576137 RepID=A0A1L7X4S6_9HELO|nr:uncharacterized protein PAC_09921 [Phialocephala subalpina]
MSFGWSAGDIVSAISLITKVSKGLKDSGGAASSYQQCVDFLESIETTLEGVRHIVDANALFADEVEKLKTDVERTMGVMNDLAVLQSLNSILKLSRENEFSFGELKVLSIGINQALPLVRQSITALDELINQGFDQLNEDQNRLESTLKAEIQDLKSSITKLNALEELTNREGDRQEKTRSLWQRDLKIAVQPVQIATETHLELQMQNLRLEIRGVVGEMLRNEQASSQGPGGIATTSAINLLGG